VAKHAACWIRSYAIDTHRLCVFLIDPNCSSPGAGTIVRICAAPAGSGEIALPLR
jgi:hypothetical protein